MKQLQDVLRFTDILTLTEKNGNAEIEINEWKRTVLRNSGDVHYADCDL